MTPYTLKSSALAALRRRYAEQRGQILGIEVRLSPFGKPESQYTGDVVWMQTCFAVEDDRGHHEPLSTLRNLCKIEVIGNRYDEA